MSSEDTAFRITIMPNGPYLVSGGAPLTQRYPAMSTSGEPLAWDPVGAEGEAPPVQEKYALCRCGQSAQKPFCDGTHAKVGFDGPLTADRLPAGIPQEHACRPVPRNKFAAHQNRSFDVILAQF